MLLNNWLFDRPAGWTMSLTSQGRKQGADIIKKLNARSEVFINKDIIDYVYQRQMMVYGFLDGIVDAYKSDVLGKSTGGPPCLFDMSPVQVIFHPLRIPMRFEVPLDPRKYRNGDSIPTEDELDMHFTHAMRACFARLPGLDCSIADKWWRPWCARIWVACALLLMQM